MSARREAPEQEPAPEQQRAPAFAGAVLREAPGGGTPARAGGRRPRGRGGGAPAADGHPLARELARAVLARQAKSLADRVGDLQMELGAASAPLDAALRARAVQLGQDAIAALKALKGGASPDPAAVEGAQELVMKVARGLASKGAGDAAIGLAAASADPVVQGGIVSSVRGSASGVAGQQSVLTTIAPLTGERIAAPAKGQTSIAWLEAQTPAIGRALKKLEQMGVQGLKGPLWLELARELLREYFTHAPADVKPDPSGKLTSPANPLKVDATSQQIEADCDVYATYGARLLREIGWVTAGYLAVVPDASTGRDAHAVALAKRASSGTPGSSSYLGVSNAQVDDLGTETADAKVAAGGLLTLAMSVYSSPQPPYKAYYAPALAGGALDTNLLDPAKHGLTPIATSP